MLACWLVATMITVIHSLITILAYTMDQLCCLVFDSNTIILCAVLQRLQRSIRWHCNYTHINLMFYQSICLVIYCFVPFISHYFLVSVYILQTTNEPVNYFNSTFVKIFYNIKSKLLNQYLFVFSINFWLLRLSFCCNVFQLFFYLTITIRYVVLYLCLIFLSFIC